MQIDLAGILNLDLLHCAGQQLYINTIVL